VWQTASKNTSVCQEYISLMEITEQLEEPGAIFVKVDFPSAEEIISPEGWEWKFSESETGSMLSELAIVRTEFYHSLQLYLNKLERNPNGMNSLEDVVAYNIQHTNHEGGVSETHPAWPTGQDTFDKILESKDWPEEVYTQALEYIRQKSRDEGIDAALNNDGNILDGLLVPLQADGGIACSVAAKAGYTMITIPVSVDSDEVPFGIGIVQTAFKEHLLVKYGPVIEDLVGERSRPTFLNLEADNYPYIGVPPGKR
jgi:amidase